MPNLTPVSSFDNVPQMETTTLALGGPGGPMNLPAQALLNRTQWLKDNAAASTAGPYAEGTGTANACAATFTPPITALADGLKLRVLAAATNTGPATFAPNALAAQPIVGGAYATLQGGEIVANGEVELTWNVTLGAWVITAQAGGSLQVPDATHSKQAASKAQVDQVTTDLASNSAGKGSALVGFIQAGTGAVSRFVQSKLRERVSVKDFGAVGDGVTDDTAAIQAAIDYCASVATLTSVGVALHFPAGQYKTSTQLNVSAAILIYGDACGASKIQTNNNYIFNCTASSAMFRDLFFKGPYGTASNGIKLDGANNAIVERCTFQNQTTGIYLNSAYAVEVIGCVFDVCYTYGIYGNTSAHNLQVERCGFFSAGRLNSGHAINLSVGSDNVGIQDNDFEQCNINVQLTDCRSVEITGNYMEYAYADHFSFSGTNYGITIESNWIALGDATGGGDAYQFVNIVGGSFRRNTVSAQSLSFNGTTLIGFTVGLNRKTGTGTLGDMWIAPTLVNSWAQQANYSTVGYTKDEDGWVTLRGAMVTGTAPSALFTLPTGFRPAKIGVYATYSASGSCKCTVNPDGTVVATLAASNNMSIDGLRFYVGN